MDDEVWTAPEAGTYRFGAESPAERLAILFHDTYERLAPEHGYKTREASAKPWHDVPVQNRMLMIAVCAEVLTAIEQDINDAIRGNP